MDDQWNAQEVMSDFKLMELFKSYSKEDLIRQMMQWREEYMAWENEVKVKVEDGMESNKDKINSPSHYNQGIEAIDYIESHKLNFNLGNVIKYVTRCEHKDNKVEDLNKAMWYIQREIDRG